MKSLGLFLCPALVLLAMSCTKETVSLPPAPGREEVELTITVGTGQTRADEASVDEDKVESLQIFIFSDGRLEAVCYSLSDPVTTRCYEGFKNIYAIVNHSEIEWASGITEEKLLETVFVLTGEEGWNTMVGSETDIYLSATAGKSPVRVEMEVKRVAARIVLRSVRSDMIGNRPLVSVLNAYITNVVGDVKMCDALSSEFSSEESPQVWYNQMGLDKNLGDYGDLKNLLCANWTAATAVRGEKEFNECFYCYPNPTVDDHNALVGIEQWIPRWTRLVVLAEYGGTPWYYVVSIGGKQEDYSFVLSNHSYEVELEITGPGYVDEEGFRTGEEDEGGGEEGGDEGGDEDDDDDEDEGGGDVELPPGFETHSVSSGRGDGRIVIRFKGGRAVVREL